MVATASTLRYFRKADSEGNEWHVYRDDGNAALCGEVQLTYNVDPISDNVPSSGTLHPACRAALAGEQPQAEAETAEVAEATTEVSPETETADEGGPTALDASSQPEQP